MVHQVITWRCCLLVGWLPGHLVVMVMVMVESDVWLHNAEEELTFKFDYN